MTILQQPGIAKEGLATYSEDSDINIASLAQVHEDCTYWYGEGDSIYVEQNEDVLIFS